MFHQTHSSSILALALSLSKNDISDARTQKVFPDWGAKNFPGWIGDGLEVGRTAGRTGARGRDSPCPSKAVAGNLNEALEEER